MLDPIVLVPCMLSTSRPVASWGKVKGLLQLFSEMGHPEVGYTLSSVDCKAKRLNGEFEFSSAEHAKWPLSMHLTTQ